MIYIEDSGIIYYKVKIPEKELYNMSITIVEFPLCSCRKCKSVLRDYHCFRCNITYLPIELYYGNEPVNNPEECMKIYNRKINRYKRMKAKAKKEMREWDAAGKIVAPESWASEFEEAKEGLASLEDFNPPPNIALSSPISKKVVYIYHQFTNNCVKNKHPIETVTVKTIDIRTKRNIDVNAYYCKLCKRYFINAEALNKNFYSKNIFPLLDFDLSNIKPSSFREFSDLYIFGYNVKEGVLTHEQRQTILADIIDYGLMGKEQIIQKLQFLVRFNGTKPENRTAKEKWQSDILFVSQYTLNNKRRIEPIFIRN